MHRRMRESTQGHVVAPLVGQVDEKYRLLHF
jgi:hypothetical protein